MTAEKWNVVVAVITIISFIFPGFIFAYKGYKKWQKTDRTEEFIVKSGKFEFFLGIGLSVLAIIFVLTLIFFLKNNIGVDPSTADSSTSIVLPESTGSSTSDIENGGIYVSDQLYQGSTYSGYVNELCQPNGNGTMKYTNGTEYTGNWVNGVRQGKGKMKYDNGVYDGEWQNDQKNGTGTYIWNDGKKYVGSYENDIRNGTGTFSGWVDLTNGYSGTYIGESENDQFNGYGTFLFDNGDKFEGVYKENFFWTGIYIFKKTALSMRLSMGSLNHD